MKKTTKSEMEIFEYDDDVRMFEDKYSEEFDPEQFDRELKEFRANYPDCPPVNPIPVLDLIMKREYAEAILRGEKKVEFREFSEHYVNRIYDKAMVEFVDRNIKDVEVAMAVDYYISEIRPVQTIHFHN